MRLSVRSDLKKLDSFTLEMSKNLLIRNFLRNGRLRVKSLDIFIVKSTKKISCQARKAYWFRSEMAQPHSAAQWKHTDTFYHSKKVNKKSGLLFHIQLLELCFGICLLYWSFGDHFDTRATPFQSPKSFTSTRHFDTFRISFTSTH